MHNACWSHLLAHYKETRTALKPLQYTINQVLINVLHLKAGAETIVHLSA